MKPTKLAPAVLMATLLASTAAHAQFATGPKASPPGPGVDAYPPGPSGQAGAAAQTNNVNVVNVPTVTVGNAVTVMEVPKAPLYDKKGFDLIAGVTVSGWQQFVVPAGQRLVLENVNFNCSSTTAQPVALSISRPGTNYDLVSVIPPVVPFGAGSMAAQTYPVHLLVDDALSLVVYRPSGTGYSACEVTLVGYLTPLQ